MNMTVEKRFLSLFLAFVMVFSLFPWWTVEVAAFGPVSVSQLDNKVTISSKSDDDYTTIDTSTEGHYKPQMGVQYNGNNSCGASYTGKKNTIIITALENVLFSFSYTIYYTNISIRYF